jgi:hypothetical protein
VTNATRGFANAVLTVSLWPDPLDTAMTGTGAAVLVSLKFTGLAAPAAEATTLYGPPTVAFAVKVEEVAKPLAFVMSVSVFVPLPNLPLAAEEGAVNVTETPLVGVPFVLTKATKGFANAVLTVSL